MYGWKGLLNIVVELCSSLLVFFVFPLAGRAIDEDERLRSLSNIIQFMILLLAPRGTGFN
jgi:hypothetical protein